VHLSPLARPTPSKATTVPEQRYVLDQSVVKGALEGCAPSLEAILTIIRRCDSIVYNGEWWDKCYACMARSAAARSQVGLLLLQVFKQALVAREKMVQETAESERLKDESSIHHKDLWLVRLSVWSKAILVTKDGHLAAALEKKGIRSIAPENV
jgi:hypothetical protein